MTGHYLEAVAESFDTDVEAWTGRPRARPRPRTVELGTALLVVALAAVGVANGAPTPAQASGVFVVHEAVPTGPPVGIPTPAPPLAGPGSQASEPPAGPTRPALSPAAGPLSSPAGASPTATGPAATTADTTAQPTAATTTPTTEVDSATPGRTESSPMAAPASPEARGEAALSAIVYPWRERLHGWSISFHQERDGLFGLTMVTEKRIEIYVRAEQSEGLLAHVIAHEIGHAVDVALNDGPDRRRWQEARGVQSSPWWPGDGTTDFSTGAGDFAESFAAWQVGTESFRSKLAGPPDATQIALLIELSEG